MDQISWNELTEQQKLIKVESWIYKHNCFKEYFFKKDTTFASIANDIQKSRARVGQIIQQQMLTDKDLLVYYALNNKLTKKQYKLILKFNLKENLQIPIDKLRTFFPKDVINDSKIGISKDQKDKLEKVFKETLIQDAEHLEEFELVDSDIDLYVSEAKKIYPEFQPQKQGSIIKKLARESNLVHINKNKFLKIDLSKVDDLVRKSNQYFYEKHMEYNLLFLSANDPELLEELGIENGNTLHSILKKYSGDKWILFPFQPRIQFDKSTSVAELVNKQLKLWQVADKTHLYEIRELFKNSNYSNHEINNLLKTLNAANLDYVYLNKNIRQAKRKEN